MAIGVDRLGGNEAWVAVSLAARSADVAVGVRGAVGSAEGKGLARAIGLALTSLAIDGLGMGVERWDGWLTMFQKKPTTSNTQAIEKRGPYLPCPQSQAAIL
jgi:hypothetical protein